MVRERGTRGMRRGSYAAVASTLALACACGPTDGPLLTKRSGLDASAASGQPAGSIRPGTSWQYQITGSLDPSVDAELYVVDLFDITPQQVQSLHGRGRIVVAYVSVGSFEPWRSDASSFPSSAIGMPLSGYPDESWLDVRNAQVRQLIDARFALARSKGFDGVFASTLGGYMEATGFSLTRADELAYDQFLADAASKRGLSAGLSGDFELGSEVALAFDWALAIGCIAGSTCGSLASFQSAGKPVFDIETAGQRDTVCAKAASLGVPAILKHTSFDAWRVPCS